MAHTQRQPENPTVGCAALLRMPSPEQAFRRLPRAGASPCTPPPPHLCPQPQRQPEKQNRLAFCQTIFYWIDCLSGCLIYRNWLMLLLTPLRPAERSILFSETSVRLSDDVRSTASLHAPKKGCAVREVRAANLHVGVAFLLLTFLWRSKEK